jgi:hypothetical protein
MTIKYLILINLLNVVGGIHSSLNASTSVEIINDGDISGDVAKKFTTKEFVLEQRLADVLCDSILLLILFRAQFLTPTLRASQMTF